MNKKNYDIEKIASELNNALLEQKECEETLIQSFEYIIWREACEKVNALQNKLAHAHEYQVYTVTQESKNELADLGFELRTGHESRSCNQKFWHTENGENWKFLITHTSCPKLKAVSETRDSILIETVNNVQFDHNLIIGNGSTVDEAWNNAIKLWKSKTNQEGVKQVLRELASSRKHALNRLFKL